MAGIGIGTQVLLDEFDLSDLFHSATLEQSVDSHDLTTYRNSSGVTETAHRRKAGIGDGRWTLQGWWDDGHDTDLHGLLGAGSVATAVIASTDAEGDRIRSLLPLQTRYGISDPVGGYVAAEVQIEGDGVSGGVVLTPLTAKTATGQSSSQDESASSTNGGVAVLHVTAASGTTPSITVKIQDSANDSTWADLASFTALAVAGSERITVAVGTTIDRYVRALWTITGTGPSFTFLVGWDRL